MTPDTIPQTVLFPGLFDKPLFAQFHQEQASSDGGAILLKVAERTYGNWCYLPVLAFVTFDRESEQYLCAALLRHGNAVLDRHAEPALLVSRARSWCSEQTEHVYTDTDEYQAGTWNRACRRSGATPSRRT